MKPTIILIALTFLLNTSYGQNELPLWKGEIPFNKKGIYVEEVNDNNRITKVTTPMLYHYKAAPSNTAKAAIIIVPGGGYIREAIDHEGWLPAKWFSERGIEAFVLKYRLPDEELVENAPMIPLMDAQEAIALVRSKASEFNIDPNKIGIIGFSAGGHLAASASTLFNQPVNPQQTSETVRPNFSILVYPVITMNDQFTHKGSKENLIGLNPSEALIQLFSLENQVTVKTPVTFIVHSLDDKAVPVQNSNVYAENLFNKGGNVTKIILPAGGHGYGFRESSPVSWWTQYLEVWLSIQKLSK